MTDTRGGAPKAIAAQMMMGASEVVASAPREGDAWLSQSIYSIGLVAVILTIAELAALYLSVFPGIEDTLANALTAAARRGAVSEPSARFAALSLAQRRLTDPVLGTLTLRERRLLLKTNLMIILLALAFVVVLSLPTLFAMLRYWRFGGNPLWPTLYALFTVGMIAMFQGFPCMVMGPDSALCSERSFYGVTRHWEYNTDFSRIAWETGMCDGVDLTNYDPDASIIDVDGVLGGSDRPGTVTLPDGTTARIDWETRTITFADGSTASIPTSGAISLPSGEAFTVPETTRRAAGPLPPPPSIS